MIPKLQKQIKTTHIMKKGINLDRLPRAKFTLRENESGKFEEFDDFFQAREG